MYTNNVNALVSAKYNEKIETTKKIIHELDNINKTNDSTIKSKTETEYVFRRFLVSLIESIDSEHAVYARVLDVNGKLISKPKIAESEKDYVYLVEHDNFVNSSLFKEICKTGEGDLEITALDSNSLYLHWFSYPKHGTVYYILVGVAPNRVKQVIDIDKFTYGLSGFIVLMLIFAYYNVYLIYDTKKLRGRCDDCPEKHTNSDKQS
jgi:hypothetical protein